MPHQYGAEDSLVSSLSLPRFWPASSHTSGQELLPGQPLCAQHPVPRLHSLQLQIGWYPIAMAEITSRLESLTSLAFPSRAQGCRVKREKLDPQMQVVILSEAEILGHIWQLQRKSLRWTCAAELLGILASHTGSFKDAYLGVYCFERVRICPHCKHRPSILKIFQWDPVGHRCLSHESMRPHCFPWSPIVGESTGGTTWHRYVQH